ncbi:MAG: hypothetical protein PHN74_03610 [Candidatus Pacebacteria bacterium]|nr:hypothetical protein [Candidatus Paceibacterota bacterium]
MKEILDKIIGWIPTSWADLSEMFQKLLIAGKWSILWLADHFGDCIHSTTQFLAKIVTSVLFFVIDLIKEIINRVS